MCVKKVANTIILFLLSRKFRNNWVTQICQHKFDEKILNYHGATRNGNNYHKMHQDYLTLGGKKKVEIHLYPQMKE